MKIALIYDKSKSQTTEGIKHRAIVNAIDKEKEHDVTMEFFEIDISREISFDWKQADILIFGDSASYDLFYRPYLSEDFEKLALSGTLFVLNHHARGKSSTFPNIDFGFDWVYAPDGYYIHDLSILENSFDPTGSLQNIVEEINKSHIKLSFQDLKPEITSTYARKILVGKDDEGKEHDLVIFANYPPEEVEKPLGLLWVNIHCTRTDEDTLIALLEKVHRSAVRYWKAKGLSQVRKRCNSIAELTNIVTHGEHYLAREESRTDLLASEPFLVEQIAKDIVQQEMGKRPVQIDFEPKYEEGFEPAYGSGRLDLRCKALVIEPSTKDTKTIDIWIEIENGDGRAGVWQVQQAIGDLFESGRSNLLWMEIWADGPLPPAEPEGLSELRKKFPDVKITYRCLPILLLKYEHLFTKMAYTCEKVRYQRQ